MRKPKLQHLIGLTLILGSAPRLAAWEVAKSFTVVNRSGTVWTLVVEKETLANWDNERMELACDNKVPHMAIAVKKGPLAAPLSIGVPKDKFVTIEATVGGSSDVAKVTQKCTRVFSLVDPQGNKRMFRINFLPNRDGLSGTWNLKHYAYNIANGLKTPAKDAAKLGEYDDPAIQVAKDADQEPTRIEITGAWPRS